MADIHDVRVAAIDAAKEMTLVLMGKVPANWYFPDEQKSGGERLKDSASLLGTLTGIIAKEIVDGTYRRDGSEPKIRAV